MERLTKHTEGGVVLIGDTTADMQAAAGMALNRLAAYEDTGLEPEQIEHIKNVLMGKSIAEIKELDDIPIKRLRELAQAEKAGRLVVLPCKVGDTIYQLRKPGHARGPGVSPRIVSCIEVRGRDYAVCHQGMEPCLKRDLGKTWFLTLQEALEALRKEANQG